MLYKTVLSILILAVVLSGCVNTESQAELGRFQTVGKDKVDGYEVNIVVDKETKCQYLIMTSYGGSMQPVLQADGKPYCPKN